MWRTLLWFVLKLAIISIACFTLWEWKGKIAYLLLFRGIAVPFYSLLGVGMVSLREPLDIVVDRFNNILPFLSLMAAMWGIGWKRRVWGTVIGAGVVITWHVGFPLIVRSIFAAHHLDKTAYLLLSPWFLFSDSLPFLLWVAICHGPLFATLKLDRRQEAG